MARKPRDRSPERAKTDYSLRTERKNIDDARKANRASAERDADGVFDHARAVADAVLGAARLKADHESLRPRRPAKAGSVVGEKTRADLAVRGERATADVALRSVRKDQADALDALLVHERAATDAFLLTERARSDDAVANRDDFLGMVAHDVRNLLNLVVLSLELMRPRDDEPAPQVSVAPDRIRRYVARMNRLIGDLVDVTSIEAGQARDGAHRRGRRGSRRGSHGDVPGRRSREGRLSIVGGSGGPPRRRVRSRSDASGPCQPHLELDQVHTR